MRLLLTIASLLVAVGLVGAGGNPIPADFKKALDEAETLELYSLDPDSPPQKGDASFHDWKVLGKTELKKDARAKLIAAFQKGVDEQDQTAAAGCFRPRHGLRAKLDGKTYDFVVCFECVQVILHGEGVAKNAGFHVSGSPAEQFNKVLKDAKVPLPKQPDDDD